MILHLQPGISEFQSHCARRRRCDASTVLLVAGCMIFGGPLQLFHAMSRSQMSYVPVMCQFSPQIGSSAVSSFSYIGSHI